MPTGEIVAGVIAPGIEAACLRPSETARRATENVAAVLGIEEAMLGRLAASGTRKLHG